MSKSYKKIPCVKDKNRGMKKFANKRVRKTQDVKGYAFYKRIVCQYDICDWKFRQSFNEYKLWAKRINDIFGKEQSEYELYCEWYKTYKRK